MRRCGGRATASHNRWERALLAVSLSLAVCAACSRAPQDGGGPPRSRGLFSDVTARSGVDFRLTNGMSAEKHVIEIMLGGLGWIDYDGDGDYDLYCVNGHSDSLNGYEPSTSSDPDERHRLFRNDGGGRFTDVTAASGIQERRYGYGLAVGDYDNDGDSDLFLTNYGRNTLYRNEGNGTFTDITEAAGMSEKGYSTGAAWFDMDRDGDLDLYVIRYIVYSPRTSKRCKEAGIPIYCNPKFLPGERDLLYENLGDDRFREVGRKAGIETDMEDLGRGLGIVVFDYDADGYLDVYVANDMNPNFLWRNNGDGTFRDVAQELGTALSADGMHQAGMGVDLGDVNLDGLTDIIVCNFAYELNALYLGQKEGDFREASVVSNLGATFVPLSFGVQIADFDLDGDPDIVTANGHINDLVEQTDPGRGSTYRQRPSMYLNRGDGFFESGADAAGGPFGQVYVGRALAGCDFDGDGDVDLAAMTLDRSVVLLRNENPSGNRSLSLRLIGTRSPRDAYGARVTAYYECDDGVQRVQAFEYHSARSYLSALDPRIFVGLGKRGKVHRIEIRWPSGTFQEVKELPRSGSLTIREPQRPEAGQGG